MKYALYTLLSVFFISIAKADTIDYWHGYYNNRELCHSGKNRQVVIKASEVKKGDVITVKYFRDTPCGTCKTYLTVRNAGGEKVAQGEGKGTGLPVSVKVEDLVAYMKTTGKNTFTFYYQEGETGRKGETGLFTLQIK